MFTAEMKNARRFAKKSVELFSCEGTFAIRIAECYTLDETAAAFEQLGCEVRQDTNKRIFFVKPNSALPHAA